MPLSSEAFNSMTAYLYEFGRRVCAKQRILLVFPMPGGPARIILGMFPSMDIAVSWETASGLP